MSRPRLDRWTHLSSGLPIGLALGACIWVLSTTIGGYPEPWDALGMNYPAALFGAGAIGGFLVPVHWAEVAVGIFTGQAVVLLATVLSEPPRGELWLLGLLVLGVYSLLALVGAGAGSGLRRVLVRGSE